jgi:hypothetical protein
MHHSPPDEPVIVSGFERGLPPLGFCFAFLVPGAAMLLAGLFAGPQWWRESETGPFALGLLFFGFMLTGIGGLMLKVRRDLLRLVPAEAVCAQIGIDETELPDVIEARGIRPRYIVNGHDYYDTADFIQAPTLLRAAMPPAKATEQLLRPTTVTADTRPETLLRARVSAAEPKQ